MGQTHTVNVLTENTDALTDVWATKLGSTKPLILGTLVSGTLTAVTDPQLHVRKPEQDPADATALALAVYTDEDNTPAKYNLQRAWTAQELAALGPGRYIAEIRGTVGGNAVVFPDAGYIPLRIEQGVP